MNETKPSRFWVVVKWLLIIALPLAAGILIAAQIPQPVIGVIYLDDAIYSTSAQDMITQINYARESPNIRAVVIVMNSPGGTVVDTESVYLELARLRQVKPVLTMVEGMAASGGYYLSVGTDYIYAKPSSLVGNIGIIGYPPTAPAIYEETYSTGPYKLWAFNRDEFIRQTEMLKLSFLEAVKLGRGDVLKLSDGEITSGKIWFGTDALRNGIIDELGTQSMAFERAAKLAKISNYVVKDLRPLAIIPNAKGTVPFYGQAPDGTLTSYPSKAGFYFLFVPEAEVTR